MNLERLLQEERQEIFQIAARHGVRDIRVFGSVARELAISSPQAMQGQHIC